jgi:hypothetical protein
MWRDCAKLKLEWLALKITKQSLMDPRLREDDNLGIENWSLENSL